MASLNFFGFALITLHCKNWRPLPSCRSIGFVFIFLVTQSDGVDEPQGGVHRLRRVVIVQEFELGVAVVHGELPGRLAPRLETENSEKTGLSGMRSLTAS